MKEKDLLFQIILSCDEALKESFLRRMELSSSIARKKLTSCEPIYDREMETVLMEHACARLSPELTVKARALWSTLLRMSRGRQYQFFVENDPDLTLPHEEDIGNACHGPILCPVDSAKEISIALKEEVHPMSSISAVINEVLNDPEKRCAVTIGSLYDTEWLYSMIYDKKMYVNAIVPTSDSMIVLMSRKLVKPEKDPIVTVAFSISEEHGSMAQALGVLSDNSLNMEYMRLKRIKVENAGLSNIIFVDLDADLMRVSTRTALLQLMTELPFFRVIGWRTSI